MTTSRSAYGLKLFEKFRELTEIRKERGTLEYESDLPIADLLDDFEYKCLCRKEIVLEDEIAEMMLDTKYAPLVGLTVGEIQEFDSISQKISHSSPDQAIEGHLNFRLSQLKLEMKQRLKKVSTLRSCRYPSSPRTYKMYQEAIQCYLAGAFQACSVLCRAIAEFIVEEYLRQQGYDGKLRSAKKYEKRKILAELLEKVLKKKGSGQIKILYDRIGATANRILHEVNVEMEEEGCLKTIGDLQSLLKKFSDL